MCTHESFGPKAVTEVKKHRRLCSTHSVTLLVEGRFLGRYTGICGGGALMLTCIATVLLKPISATLLSSSYTECRTHAVYEKKNAPQVNRRE